MWCLEIAIGGKSGTCGVANAAEPQRAVAFPEGLAEAFEGPPELEGGASGDTRANIGG